MNKQVQWLILVKRGILDNVCDSIYNIMAPPTIVQLHQVFLLPIQCIRTNSRRLTNATLLKQLVWNSCSFNLLWVTNNIPITTEQIIHWILTYCRRIMHARMSVGTTLNWWVELWGSDPRLYKINKMKFAQVEKWKII